MAMVDGDWTVTSLDIRYTGDDHAGASPSYATVIQMHRWLQDRADQETYGASDDEIDITSLNPSSRATDNIITLLNGYNIDDASSEHLYDGSIIQGSGGTEVIYDGIVNYGNATVQINVLQNGALLTDDWWNTNLGSPLTLGGLNPDSNAGISHRFMVKVRDAGVDIDSRRLIGTNRTFGLTYGEFIISATARGNNVFALADATDLNNQTAAGTVATWTDVTVTEGFRQIDINNNGTPEDYKDEWTRGARTINQFYERLKWLSRTDAELDSPHIRISELDPSVYRGITHEIDVDGPTGTFEAIEAVKWGGSPATGTGQLLAIDSPTAGTKVWIQLLTGALPINNDSIEGISSGATVLAELTGGAIVERPISTPFVGQSTGSALIGSYGLGMETGDTAAADTFFDLTNDPITPPNNVTFTVNGTLTGEDRVLVTNNSGGAPDWTQMTVATTALTSGTQTSVEVNAIPSDSNPPATGTLRITRNSGLISRHPYSDLTGVTFTITSADFSGDNANIGNGVAFSYIDRLAVASPSGAEAYNTVFNNAQTLFIRVRDGGAGSPTQQTETTASLGSSGGSATINRVSDA